MSLQNLLKPNNYELYCDTLNVNNLGIENIDVASLNVDTLEVTTLKGPSDVITLASSLVPSIPNSTAFHIGNANKYISDVWCERLHGPGAPVNIPLGLTFNNAVPAAPVTSYVLNNYVEYNGTIDLNGYTTTIVASYSATIIGSQVTVNLTAPVGTTQIGGGYIQSDPLPSEFIPLNVQYFTYIGYDQIAGTNFPALGWIDTNGALNFASDIQLSIFAGGTNIGLYLGGPIPPGARIVIQYLLN